MTSYDFHEDRPRWGTIVSTQVRVISALVRREMLAHFGESRMGYLWALIEPALHLLALMILFVYIMHRRAALGTSITLFMVTGVIPYFLYSKIASYLSGSISGNRQLLTLPPVKMHDIFAARILLESATYLLVGFVMLVALFVSGIAEAVPHDLLPVLEAVGFAVVLGSGVGLINLVITSYFHSWMTFFGFLSTPLWFLSGMWYIPDHIPEPYRGYILYNPLVHIIMLSRMGFYEDYKAPLLDVPYVVGFVSIALAVGLALVRIARRKILAPV